MGLAAMNRHAQAFELAGLWPPVQVPDSIAESPADENWLPVLCDAWQQAALSDGPNLKQASTVANRLAQLRHAGAALTLGIPETAPNTVANWIGDRLAFWLDGVPAQRRMGLLSSHLGHELEKRTAWFTALRAACTKLNADDDILVTCATVTADRFVRRCHELFGIRLLDVQFPKKGISTLRQWGDAILHEHHDATRPGLTRLILSPGVSADGPPEEPGIDYPIADRAVIALSQRLLVLSLKPRGRLLPLLHRRLGQKNWPVASVALALGNGLVEKKTAAPLLDQGAVGWVLLDTLPTKHRANVETPVNAITNSDQHQRQDSKAAPIIPTPSVERWSFLTHCTRRIDGPWPDQPEEEYFDDLILDREPSDHSALAALLRIVTERRIIASSAAIRGAAPVVSFTAVPLADIPKMRVFRAHRSRWDFEPYGICIMREWLENHDTRPVIYGDQQTWQSLADKDRPFFQVDATRSADNEARIDWTAEQEWRHLDDVHLTGVPTDAALVFVPTEHEAAAVAPKSPWPIVVLSR